MRKSISAFSAALLLAIGLVPSAEAFTIEIVPQSPGVDLGGTFTVDVRASDLVDGGAPSIGSFDLNVLFDAAILSVSSVTFGSGLDLAGFGTVNDVADSTPGLLSAFEVSFDSVADLNTLQPGAFTLFTITFLANASGTSALDLSVNAIANAEGQALVPDTLSNASVTVAPVPLPAAGWLLLSSIAGAGYFFRRQRGSARG
jgi:hypothetical protein